MKPKAQGPHDEGFLEYLEDIIGTDKYVEKIEDSFKQWVLVAYVTLWLYVYTYKVLRGHVSHDYDIYMSDCN